MGEYKTVYRKQNQDDIISQQLTQYQNQILDIFTQFAQNEPSSQFNVKYKIRDENVGWKYVYINQRMQNRIDELANLMRSLGKTPFIPERLN